MGGREQQKINSDTLVNMTEVRSSEYLGQGLKIKEHRGFPLTNSCHHSIWVIEKTLCWSSGTGLKEGLYF